MPDPIAPPAASQPAEAVELVSLAVGDGDLEAALAQYEAGAVLRPWARDPGVDTDGVADALIQLMDLRLPLSVRIRAVVPADGLALVLGERHVVGTGPDCEPVPERTQRRPDTDLIPARHQRPYRHRRCSRTSARPPATHFPGCIPQSPPRTPSRSLAACLAEGQL